MMNLNYWQQKRDFNASLEIPIFSFEITFCLFLRCFRVCECKLMQTSDLHAFVFHDSKLEGKLLHVITVNYFMISISDNKKM